MFELEIKLRKFSAAHRLIFGYHGKCAHLHGHNYEILLYIAADNLDRKGFVLDVTDIKEMLNGWILKNLDHAVIVTDSDKALLKFVKDNHQKYYSLPKGVNSTMESLSKELAMVFVKILKKRFEKRGDNCRLVKVAVRESNSSSVSYYLN